MFWWQRKKREQDLDRELRSHLDLEAEEHIDDGCSAEEARYAARHLLGNTTLIKEHVRDAWGWSRLGSAKQDIHFALRTFARTPGFTAVVILTLALGIGATTGIFSVVNAILLHPLPYPHPDRLVVIWEKLARDPGSPPVFDSYRDFQTWKKNSHSFDLLAPATWATGGQILTGFGPARDVLAMPVGIDFFALLGAKPALGRLFQRDDLKRSCTVVLKYQFWLTAFGGAKSVAGRQIGLSEQSCTVVGVTTESFTFYPDALSMWMLITPNSEIARKPEDAAVGVFGLLKPGVSIERAQTEVTTLYANQHRKDKDGISRTPAMYPLAEEFDYLTGPTLRRSVLVLFAAVIFVLLIACVNIANLLLGRSLGRQKELAVRASLGSGRLRLVRQLLTEGLLLSFSGALGGVLLAIAAVHYFRVLAPIQMPPGNPVSVNPFVLGFTALLAVLTALAFALVPALKASRVDLIDALKASGRTASFAPSARRFGKLLVMAEVSLSLALLIAAGLLIQSVNRLASVPLGFRTSRILTVSLNLPSWKYSKEARRLNFYRDLMDHTAALPGIESAAFASSLPLNNGRWPGSTVSVEGRPKPNPATTPPDASEAAVTADYFHVMGVALEKGRPFDETDGPGMPPVAIVNQALAHKYFPKENPIGQRIQVGDPGTDKPWLTIVGVVSDEKDHEFFHEMAWDDIPLVFRPVSQDPPTRGSLVLRTLHHQIGLGAAIQKQIANIDASVPVGEIETMDARLSALLAYPRFRAVMIGAFAALALILAGIGLYGVLSHLTAQRTNELAVRMALGARKQDVVALVIRQGLILTITGLFAGLLLALSLTRLLSGFLYGVKPADPLTLIAVSLLLVIVSLLATYLPARRAANVDPMVAMRYE